MGTTTVQSLLVEGTERLRKNSPSPRLDAEILLSFATGFPRLKLITDSHAAVSADAASAFREYLSRRGANEPVAYITGTKEFFGRTFTVTPDVLIPRPETEILVERALAFLAGRSSVRVLDLGTGSGCIAISIALALKEKAQQFLIVATDASQRALAVAQQNAAKLGVGESIEFRNGNWFDCVSEGEDFDIVVSNPPYIKRGDIEVSPELTFEPASALYADDNGLADIRLILRGIAQMAKLPKRILIEFGSPQAAAIRQLAEEPEFARLVSQGEVSVVSDLAGLPRILLIERR